MGHLKFPQITRIAIFTVVAAGVILAVGATLVGTTTFSTAQQAYAAKGGIVNYFCYPYTFGEVGFPETEYNCYTNMGECRKAQAADPTAAGRCFREPVIFAN
jgi:hypothetical protein